MRNKPIDGHKDEMLNGQDETELCFARQGGAPPHFHQETQRYLYEAISVPCDFHLFWCIEDSVFVPATPATLQDRIVTAATTASNPNKKCELLRRINSFPYGKATNCSFTITFSIIPVPRWPSGNVSASGPESSQARNPIPLKIRRVCRPVARQIIRSRPNVLPLIWSGGVVTGCQLRCRPRHLTTAQDDKVRP
ncbi:hypothetical protein AVEN_60312-1 [Araneus ventricosus]|uniref:Uncharacterized protein n=1 Tax=Araneus ventricosus TaxID=182803 RepID=A0A4Y2GRG3_ARAVE|nr:hypothetical protein AVEN_60312-1 [Araneus ventricosus]